MPHRREIFGRDPAGFTLLELLVVLTILAALVAVAIPAFAQIYARVRFAFDRDSIEGQFTQLPERVLLSGRGGILAQTTAEVPLPTETQTPTLAAAGFDDFENATLLHLDLPEGWSLEVPKPIIYHFNGACDGGEVVLAMPPLSLRYLLIAPLCRPIMANDSSP